MPIADSGACILILGSMPGQASLREAQYYAHPRNAFWPIMCELLSELDYPGSVSSSYQDRINLLLSHGVALWDVLASCYRPGSLDADIDEDSIEVNDFVQFLSLHPQMKAIFFNGGKAEQAFRRYVLTDSSPQLSSLHLQRLPSTSPAHASMSFSQKLQAWRSVLQFL